MEISEERLFVDSQEILNIANEYLEAHWDDMVSDIDKMVRIPSFKEEDKAAPDAPYGPGPRHALTEALGLAKSMTFVTHDINGHIGWADLHGDSTTQLGIIGHVDVVPAGPGWDFPPFELTQKDGYFLGRGITDDKGPVLMALHAVNALRLAKGVLPFTVRFIFGADEESGMGDIRYYHAAQLDPYFTFTPDAEFPVCHGEKGHYLASIMSAPLADGILVAFEGGTAVNAVPGQASCTVRVQKELPSTDAIQATSLGDGTVRLEAQGVSAHASTPELGVSAVGLLADYLLEHVELTSAEKDCMALASKIASAPSGSTLGLEAYDQDFKGLTVVGGMVSLEDGCLRQSVDVRYPTTITADEITEKLSHQAMLHGGILLDVVDQKPFLVDANNPEIQALLDAYKTVTGEDAEPFTMGGRTYACEFSHGASFGMGFPHSVKPAWVGGMHGPNEGVSEEDLRQAFRIYTLAVAKLMDLAWDGNVTTRGKGKFEGLHLWFLNGESGI